MDLQKNLEKYATLILTHGINLKPGECFTVTVQEETLPLAREITKQAYQMGAKDVVYIFNDDDMTLS